jgi:rare lipoprotein A (peptidoglycan hydrolase)
MRPGDTGDMLEAEPEWPGRFDYRWTVHNPQLIVHPPHRYYRGRVLVTIAAVCALLAFVGGFAVGRVTAAPRSAPEMNGEASRFVLADKAVPRFGLGDTQERTGAPLSPGPNRDSEAQVASPVGGAPSLVRSGIAMWYGTGPGGFTAAAPGWRYGQTPYLAAVCAFHGGRSWCLTVTVQDACACPGGRLIDLSPLAFQALGYPLSKGIAQVTVQRLQ